MAGRERLRIRGLADAARAIEALYREGGQELVNGMRVIGEEVATDVKASRPGHGVPRDKGHLAGSIRVTGPDRTGTVRVSAGGVAAPYALVQHERLDYRHNVGEARYLVRGIERWSRDPNAVHRALKENAEAALRIARQKGGL